MLSWVWRSQRAQVRFTARVPTPPDEAGTSAGMLRTMPEGIIPYGMFKNTPLK